MPQNASGIILLLWTCLFWDSLLLCSSYVDGKLECQDAILRMLSRVLVWKQLYTFIPQHWHIPAIAHFNNQVVLLWIICLILQIIGKGSNKCRHIQSQRWAVLKEHRRKGYGASYWQKEYLSTAKLTNLTECKKKLKSRPDTGRHSVDC